MANQEYVKILKQGVKVWNAWRQEHQEVPPDLRGAKLSDADLWSANLSCANLSCANFRPKQLAQAYTLVGATLPDGSSIKSPGDPDSFASRVRALRKQQGRSRM